MNSGIAFKGHVTICEWDLAGQLLSRQEIHNLVVTQGLNELAKILAGTRTVGTKFGKFQVGTDGSTTSPAMTALGNSVFENDITSAVASGALIDLDYYIASGDANTNDLQEAGIVLAADQWGVLKLFARVTFNTITKTENNAITFNWKINLVAS